MTAQIQSAYKRSSEARLPDDFSVYNHRKAICVDGKVVSYPNNSWYIHWDILHKYMGEAGLTDDQVSELVAAERLQFGFVNFDGKFIEGGAGRYG